MKSLAERKADQAEREAIKARKRSNHPRTYHRFAIPTYNIGFSGTIGDRTFLKTKVKKLITLIKDEAPYQFWVYLQEAIRDEERLEKERIEKQSAERRARYAVPTTTTPIVVPAVVTEPATGESATDNFDHIQIATSHPGTNVEPTTDDSDWLIDTFGSVDIGSWRGLHRPSRPRVPSRRRTRRRTT